MKFDMMTDQVHWLLYDKLELSPGVVPPMLWMFDKSIGDDNKGIEDTNLSHRGRLQDPNWMQISGFTLVRCPTSDGNVYDAFVESRAVELWIDQKSYMQAPGAIFTLVGTPKTIEEAFKEATKVKVNCEGEPTKGFIKWPKEKEPVLLQQRLFRVSLVSSKEFLLARPLSLYAILWGTLSRSVQ